MRDIQIQLYGGTVTVPANTTVHISNTEAILISGPSKLNQTGNLQLNISKSLGWRAAAFKFPNLPDQILLDLTSAAGKNTVIDLPFTKGQLQVSRASFIYSLPAEMATRTFDVVDQSYRANFQGIGLKSLGVDVTATGLSLEAQDLSAKGEITARVMKSAPIPILFAGNASVTRLRGTAKFSPDVAAVENVILSGLQLQRQKPISLAEVKPFKDVNAQLEQTVSFRPVGFISETVSKTSKSFVSQTSVSQPCSNTAAPANVVTATPGQESSMQSMNMPTLTQRQTKAIRISNQSLQQITLPNFAVNYPCAEFRPLVEQVLTRKGLKLIDMSFGPQEALLILDAVDGANGPQFPEAVKFGYRFSPSLEEGVDPESNKPRQELVVRYDLTVGTVDSLKVASDTTPENVLSDFSGQVGKADEAANDESSTLHFQLPVDVTKEVDLNKNFTDPTTNATAKVESKKIDVKVAATSCSILVDQIGIHVLGELAVNPAQMGCSPTQEGPEVGFSTFSDTFREKMKAGLGRESSDTWDKVSTYISRRFLSRALTQVFNDAEIHVSAAFPNQSLSPQPAPLPLTIPRNDTNCDPCPGCSGGGFGRAACELGRGACLTNPLAVSVRATCEAEKALQNTFAGTEVGRIEFAIQARANLNRSRLKLNLDDSLSNPRINADIRATAAAGGTLTLRLEPAAKVLTACVTDTTYNLPEAAVTVSTSALPLGVSFENKPSQEGFDFQLSIADMHFNAELQISSILGAVFSRPQNFVTCPLPTGALALGGAVADTLPRSFNRDFNFSQGLKSFSVGRLTVKIPGRQNPMILAPRASDLSLGVVEAPAQ